ncbi:MAG: ArnT family glycosyltransferase, partial [Phycisphaerae bacterium]
MAHVPNTDLSKHVGLDRWTLAVGLLALLVRLAYLTDASADPSFAHPIIDAGEYHRMAITLAQGFDPFNGVYTRPPLYPHLLAGLYRIVGPSASLARMLQALLGGATAMLTVLIGRRLFDRRIGLAGGIIVALYGPLVFFDVRLLASGLVVCTFQLALLLTLRAFQQSTLHAWLLAGLGIGLAALARPNILLFAPLPFVWLVLNKPRQRTGNLLRAGLLTLGVAAMIAPVTLRNYRVSGEIVPIAALGGMNLYLGNNSHAADTLAVRPGPEWDRLARQPHVNGHVSTKQAEAFFIEKVTQFVREQPGRFLAGLARKARLFCHAIEVPRNFDPYLHRDYSIVLQALFWRIGSFAFPFGLLLPLAIWGMVRAGPRRPGAWLAVGFVVCLAFSVILFFTASRYRLPIVPPLAIFAVAGAVHIYRQWTSGQRRRAAGSLSCVLVAAILVNLPITTPYDGVNFQAELYQ